MKTIVNIVSTEEPLAAYLFIKENYQPGDRLMFISERRDAHIIDRTVNMLHISQDLIDRVVLDHDSDAIAYELICRKVITYLDLLHEYHVNLAGGSRYMALAVRQVFSQFKTSFYYIQTRENVIVNTIYDDSIYDDDDKVMPIRYRTSLKEYLELHGLKHDLDKHAHQPIRPRIYTESFFNLFVSNKFSSEDHEVLTTLRIHYRNEKRPLNIQRLTTTGCYQRPPIRNLTKFLRFTNFRTNTPDIISHDEIENLTGGWFEEYVFHIIQKKVRPQDIAIGVHIAHPTLKRHNNEIDVAFVKANTFYVIECKTGVDTTRLFNEIVYKACALKESLLGTGCHSYIFSLKKDPDQQLTKVAQSMDITFCSHAVLTSSKRIKSVTDKMRRTSHEA